ncbi:uncharacterized protein LOC127968708 [Carassius gibelio]|uniref:uncharacterized protein LOC127968708 n=1 Tax=Carassius gibelio TaxID=101364 RepID=UPI002278DA5E|nr:uncharacterized protein LOC127968708 [Carassius gibelio]
MDPPENSVNHVNRTIWTVWGYLSGTVARYLRPEVTAEGNQSVHARTDEINLKSAVNKTDRDRKTNNSDNENDRAEVKCSPSKVRLAASVQWENTGVGKKDSKDKVCVYTTKKQTYHCAAWSIGTDTDSEGHTAEKVSSNEVLAEEKHANCESEERNTPRELEITGKTGRNNGDNKEACDENRKVEKCAEKREDADNNDVMIQSEQDGEQDKQIGMMDHGETEERGFKHTDETEKKIIVQKNQGETESDGDQRIESQVQDLPEHLTDEANGISKPEKLKKIDKYFDEIDEFSKNGLEEMILGTEQDEDTTDMTKNELTESTKTLQRESDDETELKMTTVMDEIIDALEETLLSDSENTPESGTGSSEGMLSGLTVCEYLGESLEVDWGCFEEIHTKLHHPQSPAEEQAEDAEHDTETQTHKPELSLKEHVEFRAGTKIRSGDEEAEAVIRNVTLQPHKLLEFTEGQCKLSQGTMNTFSETQRDSRTSETTGSAEHISDVKPVSTRPLSPAELLEELLDLQGESETDVAKTTLEYLEEITNQVLKQMIETECNFEAEPLVGLSSEETGDADHQAPARCVSEDAPVLEEEQTLLAETVDSRVEITSSEEHISSPACESTEADGRHERMQKSIAGETVLRRHEDLMEVNRPGMKRGFDRMNKDLPEEKMERKSDLILQVFEDSSLDFSAQKSRIAVKNPLVRPPKDPRKLLFRASVEPSDLRQTTPLSAPNKRMIGLKLPGLDSWLSEAERTPQTQQKSVAVREDSAKPKWTPPRHPGMGSPFMMAELKNKLKKPIQE